MIKTFRHNSLQRFFEAVMTRMHNPPHPGEVLREYLGDTTITEATVKLGVNRVTLSRVVSGASGVSAVMAYSLAQAFGTSAEMWAGMQMQSGPDPCTSTQLNRAWKTRKTRRSEPKR